MIAGVIRRYRAGYTRCSSGAPKKDAPAQNNINSSRRFYGGIKIAMITNRSKMSRLVVDAVALQSNEYCYSPPLRVLRVG